MTICNLIYTQVKQTPNRDLRQRKIFAWQVDCFRERNVLSFDLKESREGLCWRAFPQPPFFICHINEVREREIESCSSFFVDIFFSIRMLKCFNK